MIKWFPIPLIFVLSGCSLIQSNEDIVTGQSLSVDKYVEQTELVMSKAAAAVHLAREANGQSNTQLVELELSIASAYLPRPFVEDINFARARTANPSSYAEELLLADIQQLKLTDYWGMVLEERQKAASMLEAKEQEYEAERKMLITYVVTAAGSLGIVAGIAMLLLGFNRVNSFFSIGIGIFVISSAVVFEKPWFGWAAAAAAIAFIIEAWRKLRCVK